MRAWRVAVSLVAAALLAELGVRVSRVDDAPLYLADKRIGYIPAPNQSGAFLWTHRWSFNALSMGTPQAFTPHLPGSILLVGDSIVLGGNPYRAEDRLGPQLAQATGRPVWPIAAGSWALQNELQYLGDHPAVVGGVDQVVIVSNSGDFGPPSAWANELTHPRQRHWSSAWQLFRKYVWPPASPAVPAQLRVAPRDLHAQLAALAARVPRPVIVLLYPNKAEDQNGSRCGFPTPALFKVSNVRLYCLKPARGWTTTAYRDDIHPTPAAMHLLARLIFRVLTATAQTAGASLPNTN